MTLVATYTWGDKRYVLCDTAVDMGDTQHQCSTKLWTPLPGLVVGFSGSAAVCSRIMYGEDVDPKGGRNVKYTPQYLYTSIISPCVPLFKELKEDEEHAGMLIVTSDSIYCADSLGMLDRLHHNDFAMGSGGAAARVFMNFKRNFSDPYIFGKCMVSAVSDIIPSVSPHAVIELVYKET